MPGLNYRLIYPLCAMFLLTAIVLVKMIRNRVAAVKSGRVKVGYFKTYDIEAPHDVIQIGRHFSNLFEAPVLFYVATILGMLLPVEGYVFLGLAWLYVVARVIHAYVHIGSNNLGLRMPIYAFGWFVLTAMWILILIKALNYAI